MITYLKHGQIDNTLWDECIAKAVNGNVYAWSWYLDEVHQGWEALVEINDDKYLSVMPLTCKRKYGINYLCQPFFVQQLGVFSLQPITAEKVKSFLEAIPKKYRLIEIRLNEGNPVPEGLKGMETHRNHLLDLSFDYDILSANYHENTKRNLNKSLKYGLRLVRSVPMEKIISLFRADRGATVTHWGDPEYQRLLRLSELAITSSNAFVYGVQTSNNDDIICGALFLVSHDRITFLFSGNSVFAKETGAMAFLIDKVIMEFSGRSLTFDFEGSDDDQLSRFYRGFGSTTVSYPGYQIPLFKKR